MLQRRSKSSVKGVVTGSLLFDVPIHPVEGNDQHDMKYNVLVSNRSEASQVISHRICDPTDRHLVATNLGSQKLPSLHPVVKRLAE